MTMTTERIDFTDADVFRLDPYFRDESGRFAEKPAVLPAPVRAMPVVTQLSTIPGVCMVSTDDGVNHWRVRCVKGSDGKWTVLYEDDPKFSAEKAA